MNEPLDADRSRAVGQDDEALRDGALSLDFPLGVELEVFLRREDAERVIAEVRGDEPELGSGGRLSCR